MKKCTNNTYYPGIYYHYYKIYYTTIILGTTAQENGSQFPYPAVLNNKGS